MRGAFAREPSLFGISSPRREGFQIEAMTPATQENNSGSARESSLTRDPCTPWRSNRARRGSTSERV